MDEPTRLDSRYVNRNAELPYGLRVEEIEEAIAETYRLYRGLNEYLVSNGFQSLEQLLLGNSLSGIISELLVKNIGRASKTLEANVKVGGHPDLLPKGYYSSRYVLSGREGIEVKSSIQRGGWQGHNPEEGWVMVFRYLVGEQRDRQVLPLNFVEILCAKLTKQEWSFSGRRGSSRRTPTASITREGVEKLRANYVYRLPGVGVGKHRSILPQEPE